MKRIETQYMSTCPVCERLILKGSLAYWEKGQKPIHLKCRKVSVEDLLEQFKQEHPASVYTFLEEFHGLYLFQAVRKNGKVRYVSYETCGDIAGGADTLEALKAEKKS